MPVPFVVPLLTVGAIGALARRREGPASVTRGSSSGSEPSPFTVLAAFLYLGEAPPAGVVFDAVGHAESLGYTELADELVQLFVLPSGAAQGPAGAAGPRTPAVSAHGGRSSAAVAQGSAPTWSGTSSRAPEPRSSVVMPMPQGGPSVSVQHGAEIDPEAQRVLEELAYAERRAAKVELLHGPGAAASPEPDPEARRVLEELAHPERRAAKVELLGPGVALEPAAVVRSASSPIAGVDVRAWIAFVGRVAREAPTFSTTHHVGRFRQRRDRLRELGIDPATIIDSSDAQLDALDADMADAYRHARASGLVDHYLGTAVSVSADAQPMPITLSGVLGVIQAAGLEGAVQWLEEPSDRKRYPNTTLAFERCNGVF